MATGKRRQTFEKMNRERKVREKRALKAEKREQRKLEANNAVPQPLPTAADHLVRRAGSDAPVDEAV